MKSCTAVEHSNFARQYGYNFKLPVFVHMNHMARVKSVYHFDSSGSKLKITHQESQN